MAGHVVDFQAELRPANAMTARSPGESRSDACPGASFVFVEEAADELAAMPEMPGRVAFDPAEDLAGVAGDDPGPVAVDRPRADQPRFGLERVGFAWEGTDPNSAGGQRQTVELAPGLPNRAAGVSPRRHRPLVCVGGYRARGETSKQCDRQGEAPEWSRARHRQMIPFDSGHVFTARKHMA